MQKVPELAGRELTLTALSGGITNRNFRVDASGTDRPLGDPPGRQRHAPPGDQPRGRARGDRRRGRRRRRPGGDGVHPAGGLPGHPVHRRVAGVGRGRPPARDAAAGRRFAPPHPRRTGDPRAVRPAPDLRGLPGAGPRAGRARSRRPTTGRAAIGRRIEAAFLADPIELRPCHNDLLNANFIDDGARIRIIDWEYAGMGDPVLRSRQLQHQPRAAAEARTRILLEAYDGAGRPLDGWRG